jgi:hypothetical protein
MHINLDVANPNTMFHGPWEVMVWIKKDSQQIMKLI